MSVNNINLNFIKTYFNEFERLSDEEKYNKLLDFYNKIRAMSVEIKLDNNDGKDLTREQKDYIFLRKISEKILDLTARYPRYTNEKNVIDSSHLETLSEVTLKIIKMITSKNIKTKEEEKDECFLLIELGFQSLDYSVDGFAILKTIRSMLLPLYMKVDSDYEAIMWLGTETRIESFVGELINNITSAFYCKILAGNTVDSINLVLQGFDGHLAKTKKFLSLFKDKGLIKKNNNHFDKILKNVGSNIISDIIKSKLPSEIKNVLSSQKIDSIEGIIEMCQIFEKQKNELIDKLDVLKDKTVITSDDNYNMLKTQIFNTIQDNMNLDQVLNFIEADFVVNENIETEKIIDDLQKQFKQRMPVVEFLKGIGHKYSVYGRLEQSLRSKLLYKIFKKLSKKLLESGSLDDFVTEFGNCEKLYNEFTLTKQSLQNGGVLGELNKSMDNFDQFVAQNMQQVFQDYILTNGQSQSIDDAEKLYSNILSILDEFRQNNKITENTYSGFKQGLKNNLTAAIDRTFVAKIDDLNNGSIPQTFESLFKIHDEISEISEKFEHNSIGDVIPSSSLLEELFNIIRVRYSSMVNNNISRLRKSKNFEETIAIYDETLKALERSQKNRLMYLSDSNSLLGTLPKLLQGTIENILGYKGYKMDDLQNPKDSETFENIIKTYDKLSNALKDLQTKKMINNKTYDKFIEDLNSKLKTSISKVFTTITNQMDNLQNPKDSETFENIIKTYDELSDALKGLRTKNVIDNKTYDKFINDLNSNLKTSISKVFTTITNQLNSISKSEDDNNGFNSKIQCLSNLYTNYQKLLTFANKNKITSICPKDLKNSFKKVAPAVLSHDVNELINKLEDKYNQAVTSDFDKAVDEAQSQLNSFLETAQKVSDIIEEQNFNTFKAKVKNAQNLNSIVTALYWFANLLGSIISTFQWKSALMAVKSPKKVRLFNKIRDLKSKIRPIDNEHLK